MHMHEAVHNECEKSQQTVEYEWNEVEAEAEAENENENEVTDHVCSA